MRDTIDQSLSDSRSPNNWIEVACKTVYLYHGVGPRVKIKEANGNSIGTVRIVAMNLDTYFL